jgi:hypothetical protein
MPGLANKGEENAPYFVCCENHSDRRDILCWIGDGDAGRASGAVKCHRQAEES